MRESKVEKLLREGVEAAGGMCEKFVSPGKVGVPDRIVTWPGAVHFVELKKQGEAPEPHQLRDHCRRRDMGARVYVLDSKEAVDWYLDVGRWLLDDQYYAVMRGSRGPDAVRWVLGNGQ
jgi:hypothetical protein